MTTISKPSLFRALLSVFFPPDIKVERQHFYDLAQLIQMSTKIETSLESLGGEGKGIYDKASTLFKHLDQSFEAKIIEVGEIRNKAVHGKGSVDDLEVALEKCRVVLQIIDDYKTRLHLHSVVMLKVKESHIDLHNTKSYDPKIGSLIRSLTNCCVECGTSKFSIYHENYVEILPALNKHSCHYYASRWYRFLRFTAALILLASIVGISVYIGMIK